MLYYLEYERKREIFDFKLRESLFNLYERHMLNNLE
jgi:hypothetical protein